MSYFLPEILQASETVWPSVSDGCWTMPAARKKRVYDWYMEDVVKWPDCYVGCTQRWFNKVWEDHFPFVKCRKWLRLPSVFTVCVGGL